MRHTAGTAWPSTSRPPGSAPGAAEKIGVIVPRKTGVGYYDRFRHRLMFAVLDLQGRVVAFSGRALSEPEPSELLELGLESTAQPGAEPPAKYLNSPESPIYKKRETVFGLYQARQALRAGESCVVVEGNFDVMSLHARGIKQVVAPLGTAFTEEQARAICRFSKDVTLLFDGDAAGRRAVQASREPCRVAGLTAKVGLLPDKMDPDELVRTKGAEGVQRVLKAARPMLEHLIGAALDKEFAKADAPRAGQPRARGGAVDPGRGQPVRPADGADVRRSGRGASSTPRISSSSWTPTRARSNAASGPATTRRPGSRPRPAAPRSRDQSSEIGREILGIMLDFPELLNSDEAFEAVALLEGDLALALAAVRQCRVGNSIEPEQVLAKLAPSIHPFALARLAAPRHELLEAARTELLGNIAKLKKLEQKQKTSVVLGELAQADRQGNIEEQNNLLLEKFENARRNLQRGRA